MKRYITAIIVSIFALLPVLAQQNEGERPRRFNPELFKARMETYIREKANLTQEEGNIIFPVYHEMHQKLMEVHQQMHNLKKANMNQQPQDATKTVTEILNLKVKLSKIEQTYYTRMSKLIGGEKILKVMYAEDSFHREMLKLSNNEHRGGKKNQ